MERITIRWEGEDGTLKEAWTESVRGEPAALELYTALIELLHEVVKGTELEEMEPWGSA